MTIVLWGAPLNHAGDCTQRLIGDNGLPWQRPEVP